MQASQSNTKPASASAVEPSPVARAFATWRRAVLAACDPSATDSAVAAACDLSDQAVKDMAAERSRDLSDVRLKVHAFWHDVVPGGGCDTLLQSASADLTRLAAESAPADATACDAAIAAAPLPTLRRVAKAADAWEAAQAVA
jgi:hypothetical protein